jgi:hypothetical protein
MEKSVKNTEIESYFGVRLKDLTSAQLKALACEFFDSISLFYPKLTVTGSEAMIKLPDLKCYYHYRKIVKVCGQRVPLTLQLVGLQNKKYIGVKITVYDNETHNEHGVILKVIDAEPWKTAQNCKK